MAYKFITYQEAKAQVQKVSEQYKDSNIGTELTKLLDNINAFCSKYKVRCGYRIAVPNDAKQDSDFDNVGVDIGKFTAPKTLLNFLLSKTSGKQAAQETKATVTFLIATLLKHKKFNIKLVKGRCRACFDKNSIHLKQTGNENS